MDPILTPDLDERAIARKVMADRVRAFTDRSVSGAWTSPLGTALLAWTQAGVAGWQLALLWFGLINVVEVLLIGVGHLYRQSTLGDEGAPTWVKVQILCSTLLGLAWGSSVWFFWVDGEFLTYIINLMILVGVSAVSMIILAPIRLAAVMFSVGVVLPLLAHLAVVPNPLWPQIATGLVVLVVIQLRYARMVEGELFRALDSSVRNASLVALLSQARSALHETNEQIAAKNASLEAAMGRLEELVTHDELTGVFNRRFILEQLDIQIALRARHARTASVLMFDLDHFKRINDHFGHPVGDKALRATVQAVQAELRDGDQLARVGGEEFMVLLPSTSQHAAAVLGERLRQAVEAIVMQEGDDRVVWTASFGAAELQPTDDLAGWLRRVDAALYRAKAQGRNRLVNAVD